MPHSLGECVHFQERVQHSCKNWLLGLQRKKLLCQSLPKPCWQPSDKRGRDNILETTVFPEFLGNPALDCSSMKLSSQHLKNRAGTGKRSPFSLLHHECHSYAVVKTAPNMRGGGVILEIGLACREGKKRYGRCSGRLMGLLGGGTAPLPLRVLGTRERNLMKITISSKPPNHHMKSEMQTSCTSYHRANSRCDLINTWFDIMQIKKHICLFYIPI